jgi:hypothetical protein
LSLPDSRKNISELRLQSGILRGVEPVKQVTNHG